jgi:hypothetical protein
VTTGTIALVLGITGVLALADAVQLAVGVAILGVVAVVMIGQRRVDAKVQRLSRAHLERVALDTEAILAGRFDELDSRLKNVSAALGEDRVMALTYEKAISSRLARLEKDVGSLADTVTDGSAASRTTLDRLSKGWRHWSRPAMWTTDSWRPISTCAA